MKELIIKNGYIPKVAPRKLKLFIPQEAINQARRLDSKHCALANAVVLARNPKTGRRLYDQVRSGRKHVWIRPVNSDYFYAYVMTPPTQRAVQIFDRKGRAAMVPMEAELVPMSQCDFGRIGGGRERDEKRPRPPKKKNPNDVLIAKKKNKNALAARNMSRWNIL